MANAKAEKKQRPYLRIEIARPDARIGDEQTDKGDAMAILTVDRIFRNRSNAREAAAAWSQRNTIRFGQLTITEAASETGKRKIVEIRESGAEYGAASEDMRERARKAEAARSGS